MMTIFPPECISDRNFEQISDDQCFVTSVCVFEQIVDVTVSLLWRYGATGAAGPCTCYCTGADRGHAPSTVPEFMEEQWSHSGTAFATDSERERSTYKRRRDARAGRVLNELEGALRKYKLNMAWFRRCLLSRLKSWRLAVSSKR